MFGLSDISVAFLTGSPVWVFLGLAGLLGLAWLLYRRTNPPLPGYKRWLLAVIRVLAVLALMVALSEPVLSYRRQFDRPRRLAVLMDRSISMERQEFGRSRQERLDSMWSSDAAGRLRSRGEIATFYFGGALDDDPAATLPGQTALGSVLRDMQRRQVEQPFDAWLLFSDGRHNSGPEPLESVRAVEVPVLAVGMAAGSDETELAISDVDHNAVVFVGQATEVTVKLSWDRAEGETARVRLLDSGIVLAEASLAIDQPGGFGEIAMQYVPARSGQRLLGIEVSPIAGEGNTDNNRRTVSVKAMRSRVNVLLVSSRPDYEVGFMHRFLRTSDRYEVELVATGRRSGQLAGRLPSNQAELNRYDLIILHDPDPSRLEAHRDRLRSYLADRGGALWVLFGRQFASRATPDWLSDLLPFSLPAPTTLIYESFNGVPVEGQLFHPAVRLADDRSGVRETWASLPPFKTLVPSQSAAAGSIPLVMADSYTESGVKWPAIGYRRLGPGKVLAQAALPLWTWGFETLVYDPDNTTYDRMIESTVNWLTVQDDFDPIRITPEKDIFRRSEPVRFEGFAFDQGFRPLPGVDGAVSVTKTDDGDSLEIDLLERGDGVYEAEFRSLPPGDYRYAARFSKDGQLLKHSEGQLRVEPFSVEEYDQRGDPATLTAVARATGGRYYHFTEFEAAVNSMDMQPVTERLRGEVRLFGKVWLLLVFVGALGLEWLLRKLNHLL